MSAVLVLIFMFLDI